jgi:TRAP-type C4-dicarboxylate transport system permease small subunit
MKVMRFLDGVVWWALALITAVMCIAIFVQVLCRFFFGTAIVWAEEFAVLLFAWTIFLGGAYAQATDSHLSIDAFRNVVGKNFALAMDIFRLVIIAICSVVAIWQGVKLTLRALPLLYPAMEITRSFLYASVPVGFGIGLIYMAADIYNRWWRGDRAG